ncbi:chondroitin sulfate synthase 1 isoform X2 [Hippocampus zosterae]|uniref:chondroitin sulfate synthase 1 isoform X2 n=1 Tax=Hippocampus zosterae TaxID=109293 RepID=UPI00223E0311|nr:chondroitin sulfate synthase 1 isoform X2 [Hippocampus zosterae]
MAARSRRAWFGVLLGLVLGFTLASRLILPKAAELAKANPGGCGLGVGRAVAGVPRSPRDDDGSPAAETPAAGVPGAASSANFLFVGVMTAQKYLNSRAVAAHRTWARSIPGRVEFFSSEGSDASAPVPLVALSGVDDSYPPQKKSFMMLKYMHDHYLERYEWFMRADDDVYVKGRRLEEFLRRLNSSAPVFLGQTGMGARDELGKLALEPGQNFCMGGPGVIMSREVLRRVVPHLRQCLRQMYTTHEDVEVGRCVRRFAGVQCVWSYEVMETINANGEKRGRVIDFEEIRYGYRRVNPLYGAEYVLDLLLLYKKHKGKSVTVPVRRHAYLQQSFSRIQFREERPTDAAALQRASDPLSFLKMLVPFRPAAAAASAGRADGREEKVNILVPLSGRYEVFARFMANVERVCLIPERNVKLLVLLFSAGNASERVRQVELMRDYHIKYPRAELEVKAVAGPFSRALALEAGTARFPDASLLFYCDVDLLFTADFLQRCRANAAAGRSAYFPVVFSQYDPRVASGAGADLFALSAGAGLWRNFGFGVVCAHKGDLARAGGLDTSIRGWGLEDVDLFDKFLRSGGAAPFRGRDPGVVHAHHPVACDPELRPRQYKMCLGSRASSRGSVLQLARLWLDKNRAGPAPPVNASLRTA